MTELVTNFVTAINDASVGYGEYQSPAWDNPGNALVNDASFAAANVDYETTNNYLKVTDLAQKVPNGSTIQGIQIRVKATIAYQPVPALFTEVASTHGGSNLAEETPITGEGVYVFGGPSEQWGLSLTEAMVNASSFGFNIQVGSGSGNQVLINHVEAKVYYS